MIKGLKERVQELGNNLPFMTGRTKGELKELYHTPVTIREYGFLQDEKNEEYVCFIVDEEKTKFYFGGMVLTTNFQDLDKEGYSEDIKKEGLPILLGEKMGKNKRAYTTVTYYPETEIPEFPPTK